MFLQLSRDGKARAVPLVPNCRCKGVRVTKEDAVTTRGGGVFALRLGDANVRKVRAGPDVFTGVEFLDGHVPAVLWDPGGFKVSGECGAEGCFSGGFWAEEADAEGVVGAGEGGEEGPVGEGGGADEGAGDGDGEAGEVDADVGAGKVAAEGFAVGFGGEDDGGGEAEPGFG